MKKKLANVSIFKQQHITNIMYLPAILLFLGLIVYPFSEGIRIAFTNWNGYSQSFKYIGIANFVALFKDKNLIHATMNTLSYGFGSTFIQQILGLSYALLLNKSIKGRNFSRTFIYLPVLIAPVIMGYMWYFMFQYNRGALNDILLLFNMTRVDWLADGNRAIGIIVFANSVQFCGISMVIYLAGLQTIPGTYYEASEIDGASSTEQFVYITLPMLRPAIMTSIILNLIGGLKLFDVIQAMTSGGPGYASHSLSTYISLVYFSAESAGYSASVGILLFVMIIIFTMLFQLVASQKEIDL
ncbi:MAG: sugar ABC transporter permease [Spirochaetaceae bacterium]